MSIMVTEVYQALVDAGASEEKARAAAAAIPDMSDLADKNDVAQLQIRAEAGYRQNFGPS